MTDKEKPDAPLGTVEPPIMRLDASRQDTSAQVLGETAAANIRNREVTENSIQRDASQQGKREE